MNRLSVIPMLVISIAGVIWGYLILTIPKSTGFGGGTTRYWITPVILVGMTLAIQRLMRGRRWAWTLSALASGVIALASILIAAWIAGAFDD